MLWNSNIRAFLEECGHSVTDIYIVDNNNDIIDDCQSVLENSGAQTTMMNDSDDDFSEGAVGGAGLSTMSKTFTNLYILLSSNFLLYWE